VKQHHCDRRPLCAPATLTHAVARSYERCVKLVALAAPHVRPPARGRCRYRRRFSCEVGQAGARTVGIGLGHESPTHLPSQTAPRILCSKTELTKSHQAGQRSSQWRGSSGCEPAGLLGTNAVPDKDSFLFTPVGFWHRRATFKWNRYNWTKIIGRPRGAELTEFGICPP